MGRPVHQPGGRRLGEVTWAARYPVKSMRGQPLHRADVRRTGIVGDRRMAVVDDETGHVASSKNPRRWGQLLMARAEIADDRGDHGPDAPVVVALPDGRELTAGAPATDAAISAWLRRPVTLTGTPPPVPVLERETPATEPDGGVVRVTPLGAAAPPGTFVDFAPLHLVTTATLDAMAEGTSPVDPRRLRPNLVIRPFEGQGAVEDHWVGHRLRIGPDVQVEITTPTPRCAVPTLAQGDELPTDRSVLRRIAERHRIPVEGLGTLPCAGVYATVTAPGAIRVGDVVELL